MLGGTSSPAPCFKRPARMRIESAGGWENVHQSRIAWKRIHAGSALSTSKDQEQTGSSERPSTKTIRRKCNRLHLHRNLVCPLPNPCQGKIHSFTATHFPLLRSFACYLSNPQIQCDLERNTARTRIHLICRATLLPRGTHKTAEYQARDFGTLHGWPIRGGWLPDPLSWNSSSQVPSRTIAEQAKTKNCTGTASQSGWRV